MSLTFELRLRAIEALLHVDVEARRVRASVYTEMRLAAHHSSVRAAIRGAQALKQDGRVRTARRPTRHDAH